MPFTRAALTTLVQNLRPITVDRPSGASILACAAIRPGPGSAAPAKATASPSSNSKAHCAIKAGSSAGHADTRSVKLRVSELAGSWVVMPPPLCSRIGDPALLPSSIRLGPGPERSTQVAAFALFSLCIFLYTQFPHVEYIVEVGSDRLRVYSRHALAPGCPAILSFDARDCCLVDDLP